MNESNKVAHLRAKHEKEELQRINRLTGLAFESIPASLLNMQDENKSLAESLLNEALNIWKEDSQPVSGQA